MSEMINRIAAAICDRRNATDWPCNGLDFDVEMALTVLQAMREPSPEMLAAVSDCPSIAVSCWTSMMDAALRHQDISE